MMRTVPMTHLTFIDFNTIMAFPLDFAAAALMSVDIIPRTKALMRLAQGTDLKNPYY
jgi:hypothetical protein